MAHSTAAAQREYRVHAGTKGHMPIHISTSLPHVSTCGVDRNSSGADKHDKMHVSTSSIMAQRHRDQVKTQPLSQLLGNSSTVSNHKQSLDDMVPEVLAALIGLAASGLPGIPQQSASENEKGDCNTTECNSMLPLGANQLTVVVCPGHSDWRADT